MRVSVHLTRRWTVLKKTRENREASPGRARVARAVGCRRAGWAQRAAAAATAAVRVCHHALCFSHTSLYYLLITVRAPTGLSDLTRTQPAVQLTTRVQATQIGGHVLSPARCRRAHCIDLSSPGAGHTRRMS